MQPLQYYLRDPAAKDDSITHAAAAPKQPWHNHYNAICRDWVAKHNKTTRDGVWNCSSKTGSRRQSEKKTILKHFLKGFSKRKLLAPKLRRSADKSLSQPWCSHSNTVYEIQLQKTIVLRMQPRRQATSTQPLQCVLQHHVANLHVSTHIATPDDNNHAAISNAICNRRFKKRIELRTQEQPLVAEHRGGTKTTPAATAAHTRYLSSPAEATLDGKTQGFFAPASSPRHHFSSSLLPFLTTPLRHHPMS